MQFVHARSARGLAVAAALAVGLAGCPDSADDRAGGTAVPGGDASVPVSSTLPDRPASTFDGPGPDGAADGMLEGLRGPFPLTERHGELADRLGLAGMARLDPRVHRAYDSVVLTAVAAIAAGTDGADLATAIVDASRGGEVCADIVSCAGVIAGGGDPDVDGFSGPLDLGDAGAPSAASYGVLNMGPDNRVDLALTTYLSVSTGARAGTAPTATEPGGSGDGRLTIGVVTAAADGGLVPGPAVAAAVQLAVDDVDTAGGVLGAPVRIVTGTLEATAAGPDGNLDAVLSDLLAAGADAIIDVPAEAVAEATAAALEAAGVIVFDLGDVTARPPATPARRGWFRLDPPPELEAQALAELMTIDGVTVVAVLVDDDAGASAVAESLVDLLADAAIEAHLVGYPAGATNHAATLDEIAATRPNAIVLAGLDGTVPLVKALIVRELGPRQIASYGLAGVVGDALGEQYDAAA